MIVHNKKRHITCTAGTTAIGRGAPCREIAETAALCRAAARALRRRNGATRGAGRAGRMAARPGKPLPAGGSAIH